MKKAMILMSVMFIVTLTNAQKKLDKVPTAVKLTLQKNYPTAKNIKCDKEKENYEAEFEQDKINYSLLIDASGSLLETEVDIKMTELPKKATEYLAKNYQGQKIKETTKVVDKKGMVTYEAEVKGKDLFFDNDGNFVK